MIGDHRRKKPSKAKEGEHVHTDVATPNLAENGKLSCKFQGEARNPWVQIFAFSFSKQFALAFVAWPVGLTHLTLLGIDSAPALLPWL